MRTAERMRDAVLTYASYFSERNVDGILSLFSPDAVLEDPVDRPAHVGQEAMRRFFAGGFEAVGGEMHMRPEGEVRVADNHAACAMIVTCPRAAEPFWIATLDVFTFDENGLFSEMKAYWGPTNFHPLENQSAR